MQNLKICPQSLDLLELLNLRKTEDWLIGYNSAEFVDIFQQRFEKFTQDINIRENKPNILLAEPEPLLFLASFMAAVATGSPIFICNPNWVKSEWKQVFEIVKPDIVVGKVPQFDNHDLVYNTSIINQELPQSPILIPTGGSSGQIKFAIHTWETLMASVQGFQQYFEQSQINSCCVLPLYHVSGMMQFVRSFSSGGRFAFFSFQALKEGEIPAEINPSIFFISLVPTQLQRLLKNPKTSHWLSQFETVLLGGSPAGVELLQKARQSKIRLAPTYGMTETASQIVTLKPDDFLKGNNSSGKILPHAQVKICSETGEALAVNQVGLITIEAQSLAWGYYSQSLSPISPLKKLKSDDLGVIDEQGYLTIIGRNSRKIITGGENVFPAEVETAIQATGLVEDVAIIGLSDPDWGQVVTAIYVPKSSEVSVEQLKLAISDRLSRFKQPKHWIAVESLPRNSQGKLNHNQLYCYAEAWR